MAAADTGDDAAVLQVHGAVRLLAITRLKGRTGGIGKIVFPILPIPPLLPVPPIPPLLPAPRLPVVVVLDNIRSLYNTGSFFRTADACGVERLVLCGITPRPDQGGRQRRAIAKTALGAELTVPWEYQADTRTSLSAHRSSGYQIIAVETSPAAVDLYEWTPLWPVCLVFGHERDGVAPDLGGYFDVSVRIPMFGEKRSLNVATAAGVVLYELVRRHLGERRVPSPDV